MDGRHGNVFLAPSPDAIQGVAACARIYFLIEAAIDQLLDFQDEINPPEAPPQTSNQAAAAAASGKARKREKSEPVQDEPSTPQEPSVEAATPEKRKEQTSVKPNKKQKTEK